MAWYMYISMAVLGYSERAAWRLTPGWVLRLYKAHIEQSKQQYLMMRYYMTADPKELMPATDIDDIVPR